MVSSGTGRDVVMLDGTSPPSCTLLSLLLLLGVRLLASGACRSDLHHGDNVRIVGTHADVKEMTQSRSAQSSSSRSEELLDRDMTT